MLSGDYEEELLNYTSDQIIGRNFWVSARTGAKLAMDSYRESGEDVKSPADGDENLMTMLELI